MRSLMRGRRHTKTARLRMNRGGVFVLPGRALGGKPLR